MSLYKYSVVVSQGHLRVCFIQRMIWGSCALSLLSKQKEKKEIRNGVDYYKVGLTVVAWKTVVLRVI